MKKTKTIEILLTPKDFIGTDFTDNTNCALVKAGKRHFKEDRVTCDTYTFNRRSKNKDYKIIDQFDSNDYEFVREQYEKDPMMKKVQYYVTLEEICI